MGSFIRWFMRWLLLSPLLGMFMGVVLNTALPNKAIPLTTLAVVIWAVWWITAPGKCAGPACARDAAVDIQTATQLDRDARAITTTDKEPVTVDRKSSVLYIDGVPLPDDIHVLPAPESAPETHKRLLGAWAGTLDYSLDRSARHILIVEEIRADGEARVVWAFGADSECEREEGTVSGDTLDCGLATYKLTATDSLLATIECFTHVSHARMSRIELATLARPGPAIDWSDGVEVLDTDLTEDGKPVRLEVVVFKPKGSGPFPLLVFNHGRFFWATPSAITRTETHLELAEFFLEKGWMVAFPQRRGRGKSEGLHKEGLRHTGQIVEGLGSYNHHQVRVVWDQCRSLSGAERALTDIEAAVAALQWRPDVAGKRVLIGGASGGGILSIAYAGLHREQIAGVINFVGAWDGERSPWWARKIDRGLFERGAKYDRAALWLYGRGDSCNSIAHSRSNYETFVRAGGKGEFIEFDVPGDGHNLSRYPDLWREQVEKYLTTLEPADRPPI